MNNSFSQMAFNFGAETPPPLQKVEESVYVVGQENGYSGVRVRIKSLKNVKKDPTPEEKPAAGKQEDSLKEAAPAKVTASANVKQEEPSLIVPLPRVVDLKLFDLPPIEVAKETTEIIAGAPEIPADIAEAGLADEDSGPVVGEAEIVSAGDVVAVEEAALPVESRVPDAVPDVPVVEAIIPAAEIHAPEPDRSPAPVRNDSPGKPAKSKRGRKSLKQVAAEADLIEVPGDDILFSKQYYTMRAVAEMFKVNQSLLRFREPQFDILQPRKNKKGDRYFRPVDIKNLHLIYHLLRQRRYNVEGAKEFLKKNKKAEERFEAIQRLQQLKAFLLEWKAQL